MTDTTDDRLARLEARVKELESVVNEHHHYFAAAEDEETGVTRQRPNLFQDEPEPEPRG